MVEGAPVFPRGARSTGMGEIGTSLADDENVLCYPTDAILGIFAAL